MADGNLWDIVYRLQSGDADAGWEFVGHKKIKAMMRSRVYKLRSMFHWLSSEHLEDVRSGLNIRLIEIARDPNSFKLPEQRNEGKVVAYFSARVRGEADQLLRNSAELRQVKDENGNSYLRCPNHSLESVDDEFFESGQDVSTEVVDNIEDDRQIVLMSAFVHSLDEESNDRIWLKCYILRLQGYTWTEVAAYIGYPQNDYGWLKANTDRFVTRLRDTFITLGEQVDCRICGIYTDTDTVSICLLDYKGNNRPIIWTRRHKDYNDLGKIEDKLGEIFRREKIAYVVMNSSPVENPALVIIMRFLFRKEAYVEHIDLPKISACFPLVPRMLGEKELTTPQHTARVMAEFKRAELDVIRTRD